MPDPDASAAPMPPLRLAAMADVHYNKAAAGTLKDTFLRVSDEADVLLLCGDLTDYGLPEEAEVLVHDLRAHVRVPVIAVLGNHDFESGRQEAVCRVLEEGGVRVLDGTSCEVGGVGFVGTRGFGGGFGRWALSPWGEPPIKAFVQEAVDEELKLDAALSRLNTEHRVVLLHYAPVRATVVGEPEEIFPFLGSGRLEEPLNRYKPCAAFHGHAHKGAPEGRTASDVPVYNVSIPVLQREYPDHPPFRLFEVEREPASPLSSPTAPRAAFP